MPLKNKLFELRSLQPTMTLNSLTCVTTYFPLTSKLNVTLIMTTFFDSWLATTRGKGFLLIVDDESKPEYQEFLVNITNHHQDRVAVLLRSTNGGISRSKNSCIRYFVDGGFEHLFLADHDIVFKKAGWQELYISTSYISRIEHFSHFLSNGPTYDFIYSRSIISRTPHLNGPLLFFTDTAIRKIGGMHILPHKWGHEHTLISIRAINAGLAPFYVDVVRSEEYIGLLNLESIFSLDEKNVYYKINEIAMNKILSNLSANYFAPIIE